MHKHIRFNIFKWIIVILLYDHFTIKVSPKKIIPIGEYYNWKIPTPLFWKRKFKIRHCSNPSYKMPFWYLIWVVKTHLHAKGFVVPMVWTIVYRTFSNYNEWCTKYNLLSFFSIKVVVLQQKESYFQIVSIMYWQYIYLFHLECGDFIFRYYMKGIVVL